MLWHVQHLSAEYELCTDGGNPGDPQCFPLLRTTKRTGHPAGREVFSVACPAKGGGVTAVSAWLQHVQHVAEVGLAPVVKTPPVSLGGVEVGHGEVVGVEGGDRDEDGGDGVGARGGRRVVTRVVGNATVFVWEYPGAAAKELKRRLASCAASPDQVATKEDSGAPKRFSAGMRADTSDRKSKCWLIFIPRAYFWLLMFAIGGVCGGGAASLGPCVGAGRWGGAGAPGGLQHDPAPSVDRGAYKRAEGGGGGGVLCSYRGCSAALATPRTKLNRAPMLASP